MYDSSLKIGNTVLTPHLTESGLNPQSPRGFNSSGLSDAA